MTIRRTGTLYNGQGSTCRNLGKSFIGGICTSRTLLYLPIAAKSHGLLFEFNKL